MFRLRNWYLDFVGDSVMGFGECYGNPRFREGYFIHTSPALNIELGERCLDIFTESDSCYIAAFKDVADHALEHTQEVLQSRGISLDVEKCRMLKNRRIEATKHWVAGAFYTDELYVKMAGGWSVVEAYFKARDGSVAEIPVTTHESMFTNDSILVTDWTNGLCDWRIYPLGDIVKPYHWSDGLDVVYIENVGSDFVFKGTNRGILCEHKKLTAIKRTDYCGDGLFSPDVVNGKNVFSKV